MAGTACRAGAAAPTRLNRTRGPREMPAGPSVGAAPAAGKTVASPFSSQTRGLGGTTQSLCQSSEPGGRGVTVDETRKRGNAGPLAPPQAGR